MWTTFFVAASGASAALAGLVFVALSVNISHIIKAPHLPPRAAATISTLILILVCSMAELIPQRPPTLGVEIFVFGICGYYLQVESARQTIAARSQFNRPRWESVLHALLGQIQVLPFIIGGILLWAGRNYGSYWIGAGCIAIFIFSVLNSWVLLVEILR
jgi:hypothetical protein